jgi:hypothetical protein
VNLSRAAPWKRLRTFIRKIRNRPPFAITLDYPVHPQPRYGYGRPLHQGLLQSIEARRESYRSLLQAFRLYQPDIQRIGNALPWINDYLTALDAITLYGMIREHRPRLYIEIGSGNSTRVASRAIQDAQLETEIISIDPHARIEIRSLANQIVEQPVEDMPLDIFDSLQSGDILFVDHSHRVFTNSDSTVVFLDILPKLKPGVLVHFHDIFLPADYPPEWNGRYYAEQYLLACHLIAHTRSFEILLANSFISGDAELSSILDALWAAPSMTPFMKGAARHGCSFWVRIT